MIDKVQKIREEVEKIARSINPYIPDEEGKNSEYEAGRFAMVTQIMQIIDSMQEEPVSGLDNGDMPVERWKQAVKAASNQGSYRSSKGLTETRDDYFVDGVQWADEHPKEEPVSEDLGEYVNELSKQFPDVSFAKLSRIAVRVAKWQKKQVAKKAGDWVDANIEKYISADGEYNVDWSITDDLEKHLNVE